MIRDHDPAPPANAPLPSAPLDKLQAVEARHVLLHVAQEATTLRTTLAAMFAHAETRKLLATEKVQRGVQSLIEELEELQRTLGEHNDQ